LAPGIYLEAEKRRGNGMDPGSRILAPEKLKGMKLDTKMKEEMMVFYIIRICFILAIWPIGAVNSEGNLPNLISFLYAIIIRLWAA
jgi:hypothetical protein